jgi:hypothetical protein
MPTSTTKSKDQAENIPLRLRRRRDGSLALMDADGRPDGDERTFPRSHVFTADTALNLAGAGAFELSGDALTVRLCNATATYQVDERRANGEIAATLVSQSMSTPPPVDEHRAFEIQIERRDREVASIVEAYGVDEATAERIAVDLGRIPTAPTWPAAVRALKEESK